MAQEVTSRDFRLFIEEQKRTNRQLEALQRQSSEENSNTLLVGDLLKDIREGNEEAYSLGGYLKRALPIIANDWRTQTALLEEETTRGLFDIDDLLKVQNKDVKIQNDTLSNIFKTLKDNQLILQYQYAIDSKRLSIEDANLQLQKQLEFRKERDEARGDGELPITPKEEEDEDKKTSIFAAAFGPLKALLIGTVGIFAGLYAFALALKNPEFKEQTKKTFEALGDLFDSMKSFFVTISPAVTYIANFSFKALELAFKGLKSMFINLQDFIDNGPKPETYQGLPAVAYATNKSATTTATGLTNYLNRLKTAFMEMDIDIVQKFKPLNDALKTTTRALKALPFVTTIFGVFGKTGSFLKMLGKASGIVLVLQGAYEGITGFLDEWEKTEGEPYHMRILKSVDRAVRDVVDALIYAPIDFVAQSFGWLLGKMGIQDENNENFMKDFSIENALNQLTTNTTNFLNDLVMGAVSKVTQVWDDFLTWWDSWNISDLLPDWAKIFVNDAEPLSTEPGNTGATFDSLSDPVSGFKGGPDELRNILDYNNLTQQQLDLMKSLNNNQLMLLEQGKFKGDVNVVSGGNNISSVVKSDLTLSKSTRPDDYTYDALMTSA